MPLIGGVPQPPFDPAVVTARDAANAEMRRKRANDIDRAMQLSITCEMLDAKGHGAGQEVMFARGALMQHLQKNWPSTHLQDRTLQRDIIRVLEKLVVQHPDLSALLGMSKAMLASFRADLSQ